MSEPHLSWWIRTLARMLPAGYRHEILTDLLNEQRSATRLAAGIVHNAWTCRRGTTARTGVLAWWDGLRVDLRHVTRGLRHTKALTSVVIVSLTLGIGVNIAVFSVFDALVARPLPYAEPDRLVQIQTKVFNQGSDHLVASTYEVNFALREEATSLEDVAWDDAARPIETSPSPGANPIVLLPVTANTTAVLGVRPLIGRGFVADDAIPAGGETAVLLTYDAWKSRFHGDAAVLTRSWGVDTRYRIVGVLPRDFYLPSTRLYRGQHDGLVVKRQRAPRNGLLTVAAFGRLRDQVSVEQAQAEVNVIAQRHGWSEGEQPYTVTLQSLRSGLSVLIGPYVWLTSSAVWLVLGVMCVNLSTLLLMRGRSRDRLTAVRAALGASTGRLVRLAFLEALTLCAIGGAVAWLIAAWTAGWIESILPTTLRGLSASPLNLRTLWISVAAVGASAVLAGIIPALAVRRLDILGALRGNRPGRHARSSLGPGRLFLGMEAAFGVVVVVGAVVTTPPLIRHLMQPAGLDARDLYTVTLGRYQGDGLTPEERLTRVRSVAGIVGALPHVTGAVGTFVPPYGTSYALATWTVGSVSGGTWPVDAGVFRTIGTPLRAGREFAPEEVASAAPVVIVNETAARALWPNATSHDVLGRTIEMGDAGVRTVIGVVADVRRIPGTPASPAAFVPFTAPAVNPSGTSLPIVVRMSAGRIPDPELIRVRLRERFPQHYLSVESVAEVFSARTDRARFLAVLFGTLAGITLLLAAIGVYAVAAFETVRRRHDMAIRLALGSSSRQLRYGLLREVLTPVIVGTAAGLMAAWIGVRTFQAQWVDLEAVGLSAYVLAGALVLVATLAATWLPTRAAVRINAAVELQRS